MIGTCQVCNKTNVKIYATFGKYKCKQCIDKSKTGRKGNSGMIYDKNVKVKDFTDITLKSGISLKLIKKSHKLFVKWFIEHYPKSKGIPGRQCNYLIYYYENPVGIISGASPPLNYKIFRKYFNTENEKLFVNNNVFRIVKKPKDKNFGTKVLKLFRNTIYRDYYDKYEDKLLGIVAFVEPPRTGAIYKADNWENLGKTQGIEVRRRGNNWLEKTYSKGISKYIFGYKYKKDLI